MCFVCWVLGVVEARVFHHTRRHRPPFQGICLPKRLVKVLRAWRHVTQQKQELHGSSRVLLVPSLLETRVAIFRVILENPRSLLRLQPPASKPAARRWLFARPAVRRPRASIQEGFRQMRQSIQMVIQNLTHVSQHNTNVHAMASIM